MKSVVFLFYLNDILSKVESFTTTIFMMATLFLSTCLCLFVIIMAMDGIEECIEIYKRTKQGLVILIIIAVVSFIPYTFIPAKSTRYAYITASVMEKVKDNEVAKKIYVKILKLLEKKENKK